MIGICLTLLSITSVIQSVSLTKEEAQIINVLDRSSKQEIVNDVEIIDPDLGNTNAYDLACHICAVERAIDVPIVEREISFNKPDFKKSEYPCPDDENLICTNVNINFSKLFEVHTKIVGIEKKIVLDSECCPGWRNASANCCMEPICNEECLDGEICVAPDTCKCPEGKTCKKNSSGSEATGGICEKEKPCDHFCLNIESSYMCLCKPGFTLVNQHNCVADDLKHADNPLELSELERDADISFADRLEVLENMVRNNKKAVTDVNKKLREMFHVTDFLNTKIDNLEKENNSLNRRISLNEMNMKPYMDFISRLWRNNKEMYKRKSIDVPKDYETI